MLWTQNRHILWTSRQTIFEKDKNKQNLKNRIEKLRH